MRVRVRVHVHVHVRARVRARVRVRARARVRVHVRMSGIVQALFQRLTCMLRSCVRARCVCVLLWMCARVISFINIVSDFLFVLFSAFSRFLIFCECTAYRNVRNFVILFLLSLINIRKFNLHIYPALIFSLVSFILIFFFALHFF